MVDDLTAMFKDRHIPEADQQQKLRAIAARHFDFAEMTQSAIGDRWSKFTPAQKAEILPLLSVFIEDAYISLIESYSVVKINQHFKSSVIQFVEQTFRGPDFAEVSSTARFGDRKDPISVTYLMRRDGNKWKIYDLKVNAVSVLGNFRRQFVRMLNTGGYDQLINLIRGPEQIAT